MSENKFLVSRDKLSRITQILIKYANVKHGWKIQKLENSFEKHLKNWYGFLQTKLKNWHLARQVETLTRLWDVGMLAHKNEKLPHLWHIDMLTRGHVNCASIHGTHGMRFSKLSSRVSSEGLMWLGKNPHL